MSRATRSPFPVPVSDEDAREMRENLTAFFSILAEWSEATALSASTADEKDPTTTSRGRSSRT